MRKNFKHQEVACTVLLTSKETEWHASDTQFWKGFIVFQFVTNCGDFRREILSWRIFWLTMMNRAAPNASPTLAFTALEIRLLDQLAKVKDMQRPQTKSISGYLIRIARLGGYLARAGDARWSLFRSFCP